MSESLSEALERLNRAREAERRARERHRDKSEQELREQFWKLWVEYDQEPHNIRKQIIAVARRMTGFQFTPWNVEAFVFDVLERSIMGFSGFDPEKASFVTWVCNRAWSVANNIIRTSKRDLSKGPDDVGRGRKWPYNAYFDIPFSDLYSDEQYDDYFHPTDVEEWELLRAEEPDVLLTAVHQWIAQELGNDESRRIIEAVWESNVGVPYYVPGERGIASRTGYSIAQVREIMAGMRARLSTAIKEAYDKFGGPR